MKKETIVIIDDEEQAINTLVSVLRGSGYRVVVAWITKENPRHHEDRDGVSWHFCHSHHYVSHIVQMLRPYTVLVDHEYVGHNFNGAEVLEKICGYVSWDRIIGISSGPQNYVRLHWPHKYKIHVFKEAERILKNMLRYS